MVCQLTIFTHHPGRLPDPLPGTFGDPLAAARSL